MLPETPTPPPQDETTEAARGGGLRGRNPAHILISFHIHFFELAGETVWGATARILTGFLTHLAAFLAAGPSGPAPEAQARDARAPGSGRQG